MALLDGLGIETNYLCREASVAQRVAATAVGGQTDAVELVQTSGDRTASCCDGSDPGGAMARIGHVWRAKPGKIEEYKRFHATVWPELEQLLKDAGVTSYVIYAWDDILFSHMEVEDYDRMVEIFNGDPVAQRWEEEVGELIEYPDADPKTGWPRMLDEVWTL